MKQAEIKELQKLEQQRKKAEADVRQTQALALKSRNKEAVDLGQAMAKLTNAARKKQKKIDEIKRREEQDKITAEQQRREEPANLTKGDVDDQVKKAYNQGQTELTERVKNLVKLREQEEKEKPKDYIELLEEYGKQIISIIKAERQRLIFKEAEAQGHELLLASCRELNTQLKSLTAKHNLRTMRPVDLAAKQENNLREIKKILIQMSKASELLTGGEFIKVDLPKSEREAAARLIERTLRNSGLSEADISAWKLEHKNDHRAVLNLSGKGDGEVPKKSNSDGKKHRSKKSAKRPKKGVKSVK